MASTISSVWSYPVLLSYDNLENCFSQTGMDKFITVDTTNHSVTDILGGELIHLWKAGDGDYTHLEFDTKNDPRYLGPAASQFQSSYTWLKTIWFKFYVSSYVFVAMFGSDMNFTKYRIVAISDATVANEFIGFECMGGPNMSIPQTTNKFINDQAVLTNSIADTVVRSSLNSGISDYYVLMPIFVGNKCARNFYTIDCGTNSVSLLTPFIISNTKYISPYAKVAIKID
jgi:hypothetical protein